MILRQLTIRLLVLLCLLCFGCKKSAPSNAPATNAPGSSNAPVKPPSTAGVIRLHWLGKTRIAADTNAADLLRIWSLPESAALQEQTLKKLSAAPWRFLRNETNPASTNLLHPLLQDLVDEESFLGIDQDGPSNTPVQMVLAIRLTDSRDRLWQTNLIAALTSLTGMSFTRPSSERWALNKHHDPNLIEIVRSGEWTLLGSAQNHNALLEETLSRIKSGQTPFALETTNSWLEASIDLPRVAAMRSVRNAAELPYAALAVFGEAQSVRMHGELMFHQPISMDSEPWKIPTNLISAPLNTFTAVRGIQPWLATLPAWTNLQVGAPPNQLYLWSASFPMETYLAAPLADASNCVSQLADKALQKQEKWFGTNGIASFRRSESFNGLEWRGVPFMYPFLQSTSDVSGQFVFGGFFRSTSTTNPPMPPELLSGLLAITNLVFYDRETPDTRLQQWFYMGQFIRFVLGAPQMAPDTTGLVWLRALNGKIPSDCVTEITQATPDRLVIDRRSSIGFAGFELQLLADWLESPDFPFGLHTLSHAPPLPQK